MDRSGKALVAGLIAVLLVLIGLVFRLNARVYELEENAHEVELVIANYLMPSEDIRRCYQELARPNKNGGME